MKEPSCRHKGQIGPDSVMVSSHKHLTRATGRMASVRVCDRQKCVDEAIEYVSAYMGHRSKVYRNGVAVA